MRIEPTHGMGLNRVNHKGRLDQSVPEAYTLGLVLMQAKKLFSFYNLV